MSDHTETVIGARRAMLDAMTNIKASLGAVRENIAALQAERTALNRQSDDFATVTTQIEAAIEEARSLPLIGSSILKSVPIDAGNLNRLLINAFSAGPLMALAHLTPDTLRDALLAPLDREAGISPTDRAAELARIEAAMLAAEVSEEVVLRELDEATGGYTPRRADADPAILLAPDSELAAAGESGR